MISKGSLVQIGNGNPEIFVVISDPYILLSVGLVVQLCATTPPATISPCLVNALKVISQ